MAVKVAKAAQPSVFSWEGVDRKGNRIKGELTSLNVALVKAQLRRQGIVPGKVKKKSNSVFSRGKKIKPLDIAFFTRQMATMMRAGVPLLQAFDIIAEGVDKQSMRDLVNDLKQEVAAGNSFASALRRKPEYFDELYCNLVNAGEQAGALETLLDRVATYKEKPRPSRPRSRRP